MTDPEREERSNLDLRTTVWGYVQRGKKEDTKFLIIVGVVLLVVSIVAIVFLFQTLDMPDKPGSGYDSSGTDTSSYEIE